VRFSIDHERNRIPSEPPIPLQQRRWTRHAQGSLCQQVHVCLRVKDNGNHPGQSARRHKFTPPQTLPYSDPPERNVTVITNYRKGSQVIFASKTGASHLELLGPDLVRPPH
jgi:hypothetical protein